MKAPKYRTGHTFAVVLRQIVADPNGSREERRAAKRLAGKAATERNRARLARIRREEQ